MRETWRLYEIASPTSLSCDFLSWRNLQITPKPQKFLEIVKLMKELIKKDLLTKWEGAQGGWK